MKVLITGGAGFIGSNYCKYALNHHEDWDIVCLDILSYAGDKLNLDSCLSNNRFHFVKGDISNRDFIFYLFEKENFDLVINFAAESHVDRSINNSAIFIKTNVTGVDVLLSACLCYKVKRYHQISTDEVYGELPLNMPNLKFTESTPISASSPYAASKASADLLVQAYYKTYCLPVTISRCSNNYGPNHLPEKLIPLMITRALQDKELPIYGNGKNVRDWIYVEDHCRAVDLIIKNGKIGEVYNVGGDSEKTNIEVVKAILEQLNLKSDKIKYVEDRLGHDLRYAIDYTKINEDLQWTPETKFSDGIMKTVNWYKNNVTWWEHALKKIEQ